MFVKVILPATKNTSGGSQVKVVKDRLARWRRGDYKALWDEAVEMTKVRGKPRKKTQQHQQLSQEEMNAQRAQRLAQQGEYTRAVQSLTSAGLAQHNASSINQMKAKH